MKIIGRGTDRLRLKLRIMSDDDLWWVFLNHREECSHEFWEELETRKAADSNLIKLTPEEWEARRRRKMFRVNSA